MKNEKKLWKQQIYNCPQCKLGQFKVVIEEYAVPKDYEEIFRGKQTEKRAVIVCANCNKRIYPEDAAKQ